MALIGFCFAALMGYNKDKAKKGEDRYGSL